MTHDVRDLAVLARDAAMSTTYKPALLKAIVRLQRDGARNSVSLAEIANQFVELYWTQTVVFHLRQASTLAKEPEVLRALRTAASKANTRRLADLSDVERDSLAFSISKTLRINVLRLFHKRFSAGAPPLFSWDEGEAIVFTPEASAFVHRNAMTLETIANHWWARKLEKLNLLAPAIIEKIEGDGVQRKSLRWFYERVAATDNDVCFYCRRDLSDDAQPRDVDHVIPWSFLLANPTWDLVMACRRCNIAKSDRLPNRRFVLALDDLNAHRLTIAPNVMRGVEPMPTGGLLQLYEAARGVEWPNAWEPTPP